MRPIRHLFGLGLALLAVRGHAQHRPVPADTAHAAAAAGHREAMPVFPGGPAGRSSNERFMRFLQDGLKFPLQARRDHVNGRVLLAFAVDSAGRTGHLRLVQGLRADVDSAVIRHARRLRAVRWQPGTQDGRPVSVSFTVPISFSTMGPGPAAAPDSLDLGPYQKLALPLLDWNDDRRQLPAGKGLVYGSCLQRLGGGSSFGTGEYVRLVNLTTHKSVRLNVKPMLNSRRENAYCYALPAGRYALFLYEYPDPVWGGYQMHIENIRKPGIDGAAEALPLPATRYQFVVAAGRVHYVGTWNLANENEPAFLNEKAILDARIQASYPSLNLSEALVAVPQ